MRLVWICWSILAATVSLHAVNDDPALALLEGKCLECHNPATPKGGLDLTSQASLLRGGETGPTVVAKDPEKSLLWILAARKQKPFMPHKRDKLSEAEILRTLLRDAGIESTLDEDGGIHVSSEHAAAGAEALAAHFERQEGGPTAPAREEKPARPGWLARLFALLTGKKNGSAPR